MGLARKSAWLTLRAHRRSGVPVTTITMMFAGPYHIESCREIGGNSMRGGSQDHFLAARTGALVSRGAVPRHLLGAASAAVHICAGFAVFGSVHF